MLDREFNEWTIEFFVRFPSVKEWLDRSSPDPKRTLEYWRKTLEPYSLAECNWVLDQWTEGGSKAFAAYERDNIPVVVKSTIERWRQKQRDRENVERERHYRQQGRRQTNGEAPVAIRDTLGRLGMRPAIERLDPLYKKMKSGELTEQEYEVIKDNVLRELEN